MRVHEALGEVLGKLGVDTVFGLVGGGNFSVSTAMVERGGIRFHAMRHESAAVSAADGWARATRRVGVATCTQGPGLTNTMTALVEAVKSRTPLLLIAGDTARTAQYQNQDVDQPRLARAAGAGTHTLRSPELAVADLAHALWRAEQERRPIVLSLPLDVQQGTCESVDLPPVPRPPTTAPAPDAVRATADLLAQAQRPVVLAGRGVWYADAADAVVALADRTGALLATSAIGNGLFAGHPCDLGISGGFASPLAARLIGDADVVLAFGASVNNWTTKSRQLLSNARVIQCDVDSEVIGRLHPVELGLVGDARLVAEALDTELARRRVSQQGYRTEKVMADLAGYERAAEIDDRSGPEGLDPRTVMATLERKLPSERTIAIDSGHFMGWPAQYLSVTDPGGFVFTQAYQSIGLGLGSAIGAAAARPDRPTVLVTGDGGLMMGLGELETVMREGLRMVVVVLNDAAYGAEIHHFGPMGMSTGLAEFSDCDFAAIASGLGFRTAGVRALDELEAAAAMVADVSVPVLLDCKVNPQVRATWLEEAFRLGS